MENIAGEQGLLQISNIAIHSPLSISGIHQVPGIK